MQLLIGFFTALLPNILPNDFFIPVTPYRADERTFRRFPGKILLC
jgi:hypothetical protein